MLETITISSKRQITIPAKVYSRLGLQKGDKLILTDQNDSIKLTSAENIVENLAGSVKVPHKYKGKSMEEIVRRAKSDYFKQKYE